MTNRADNLQSASVCEELQPHIIGYALGEELLDEIAQDHLRLCPACRATMHAYRAVLNLLPFEANEVAPSDSLRTRLLATVETQNTSAAPRYAAPIPVAPKRRTQRIIPRVWAMWATTAALFLALFGWNISLQQRVDQQSAQIAAGRTNWQTLVVLMNEPDLQVQQVLGASAHGTLWKTPTGRVACIMAEDLPALQDQRVFQVWLRSDTGWVSGGTFTSRNGRDWFIIQAGSAISDYSAIQVTAEPSGGSPAPSGPPLLETTLVRG